MHDAAASDVVPLLRSLQVAGSAFALSVRTFWRIAETFWRIAGARTQVVSVETLRRAAAAFALFFLGGGAFGLGGAFAQTTNLSLYQELAIDCLGEIPASFDSLTLNAPERMPYVRSALITHWQDDGRTIFQTDSTAARPQLTYEIEDARVLYDRDGRDLAREIVLALRYSLMDPAGRIVADDRCVERHSDVIARDALTVVQEAAYAETQGEAPQGGWFRRYVEPAVIAAATAVAVYLFFTLRSRRADDS